MSKKISINQFIHAIQKLPSDKPRNYPGKWYKSQKEHWLGWLREYHGPGAYGRQVDKKQDAKFAYNHIVEHKMLLWLIKAARVKKSLVASAESSSKHGSTMQEKSAAIRKYIPWEVILTPLWAINNDGLRSN